MKKSTRFTFIWHRALMLIVLVISGLGVIFNEDVSAKSEYLFTCWQSAKFLIISCLPFFLKKLKLDIPDAVYIVFLFYIVAHFICGEILDFYVKLKWWDSFLHLTSGMAIALLSFSFINLLNNNTDNFKMNILFSAFFAFSMTVMVGALWEIIEFTSDSWFNTNKLNKSRSLMHCERDYNLTQKQVDAGWFYLMSVDVARYGENDTSVFVFKVRPRDNGWKKDVVYTENLTKMNLLTQAARLKELNRIYRPKEIVIDGKRVV